MNKTELIGELVAATFVRGSGTEIMIRKVRKGTEVRYYLYVGGVIVRPFHTADAVYAAAYGYGARF